MTVKRREEDHDEIENWISIDMGRLDKEWCEHSMRFFKLSLRLAKAREMHVEAKVLMDLCYAKTADRIRNDPDSKKTENAIKETVQRSKEYQAAQEGVSSARENMDFYEAAVNAMEHRKRALENIVILRGQSYFADPKDRSGGEADKHFNREAAREKVKLKLKRRHRD